MSKWGTRSVLAALNETNGDRELAQAIVAHAGWEMDSSPEAEAEMEANPKILVGLEGGGSIEWQEYDGTMQAALYVDADTHDQLYAHDFPTKAPDIDSLNWQPQPMATVGGEVAAFEFANGYGVSCVRGSEICGLVRGGYLVMPTHGGKIRENLLTRSAKQELSKLQANRMLAKVAALPVRF